MTSTLIQSDSPIARAIRAMRTASSAVAQPAVFGRIANLVQSTSSMTDRLFGSSKSILRRATVTISAPEAAKAAFISSLVRYFPDPTISLLLKVRPAITSGPPS